MSWIDVLCLATMGAGLMMSKDWKEAAAFIVLGIIFCKKIERELEDE